jgi:predicted secreted protein
MATHTGIEGTVKVGSNAIAEVRSFSIKQSAETIEDTTITDTAKTYLPGQTSWSADVSCFWDETDTSGQGALTVGSSVTLNLYPEGAATGDTYYTGSAIVTSLDISVPTNGMIEASMACQGSGALTLSTAA